ncbi:MAG TPA: hypothetical protein VF959_01245 [Casimicrobiaceae bacterium]
MMWNLAGRWKHLVDGIRGRVPHPRPETPDRDREPEDPLEREIEQAHDMRIGQPSDREFRH